MTYHDENLASSIYARTFRPGLSLTVSDNVCNTDDEVSFEMQPMLYYGVIVEGALSRLSVNRKISASIMPNEPIMLMVGEPAEFSGRLCSGVRYVSLGLSIETDFIEELSNSYRTHVFDQLMQQSRERIQFRRLPSCTIINAIVREMAAQPLGCAVTNLRMEACTLNLVAEIARCLRGDGLAGCGAGLRRCELSRTHKLRDLLEAHLQSPLSLSQLSRELGVNPTTMSAQFRQCFGTSIFGYLRQRRLEVARDLLRAEEDSIARIGYRVGFESPAAFATAFKRQFGYSPRQESRPFSSVASRLTAISQDSV